MRAMVWTKRASWAVAGALALALCLGAARMNHGADAARAGSTAYSFTFTISRAALPRLFYQTVSYVAHLGAGASQASATVGGVPAQSVSFDPGTGDFVFSSDRAGPAVVTFVPGAAPGRVSAEKAALLGNKKWAWSHGMDDNVYLQAQIDAISAKGWRASLFVIGEKVSPTRQEPGWIIDQPGLVALANQGWNVGDHTRDHACYGSTTDAQNILDGYAVVQRVLAASAHPEHTQISFAAPCFDTGYDAPFNSVRAGTTTLLVNETGGNPLMRVDGPGYASGDRSASAVSGASTQIGRDTSLDSDTSATDVLAWMAANAGPDRHFWLNTMTHGNNEARLKVLLDAAYSRYGPGGSDEIWMAPEDEIYSYLVVRDATSLAGAAAESSVLVPVASSAPAAPRAARPRRGAVRLRSIFRIEALL